MSQLKFLYNIRTFPTKESDECDITSPIIFSAAAARVSGAFDLIMYKSKKKVMTGSVSSIDSLKEDDSRTCQTRGEILAAACRQVDPPPGRHLRRVYLPPNRVP